MTGSTKDDGAFLTSVPLLGIPGLTNGTNYGRAADNETLESLFLFLMGIAENREELYEEILEHYPLIKSEEVETRAMAASDCMTDWIFTSTRHWEASRRVE